MAERCFPISSAPCFGSASSASASWTKLVLRARRRLSCADTGWPHVAGRRASEWKEPLERRREGECIDMVMGMATEPMDGTERDRSRAAKRAQTLAHDTAPRKIACKHYNRAVGHVGPQA